MQRLFTTGSVMCVALMSTQAQAQNVHFSIPAQELSRTLQAIGIQSRTEIVFPPEYVAGKIAPAINSNLTVEEALAKALSPFNLGYRAVESGYLVVPAQSERTKSPSAARMPTPVATEPEAAPTEIIVTAQQREQRLQDVPVVVSVLSGQQMQNAGIRDVKGIQDLTPGLNVTQTASTAQTSIRIRGIGTIGDNPGLESSVGTVIDGVYRARSSVAFGDLGPVERIEVLKGPQSTLFGKNTSAGVINIVSKKPTFDPKAEFEGSYGNYDMYRISGYVTGPIVGDTVAASLYASRKKRDGFYHVRNGEGPSTQSRDSDENYHFVKGQLLFDPTPDLSIRLIGDYAQRDENCCVNTPSRTGATAAFVDAVASDEGTFAPADPFQRIAYANRENVTKVKDYGFSASVGYEMGDVSLTSISAYRNWYGAGGFDADYSSADIWYRPESTNNNKFEVLSQELRLNYVTDRFDFLLGGYYSVENLKSKAELILGSDFEEYFGLLLSGGADPNFVSTLTGLPVGSSYPVGFSGYDTFDHKVTTGSIYGDGTFEVVDGLKLNIGLRYTTENKRLDSQFLNTPNAAACPAAQSQPIAAAFKRLLCIVYFDSAFDSASSRQKSSTNRLSGSAKISYRVSPELMIYASYANGWKSGGFNLDRKASAPTVINPDTSFETEKVQSYEIGAKTTLLNGRLQLNGAGFYQRYQDFQLLTFLGTNFLVLAIPSASTKGVDADMYWRTGIKGLTLNAGVSYADTKYGNFTPPPGISDRLPNNRLSFAAKWNVTAGFSSRTPVSSDLELTSSASVKWTSRYNTGSNLDPVKVQDPYAILNTRVGLTTPGDKWALELWAQNLSNSKYYQVIIDQPLQTGTYGAYLGSPRTYGMTARVQF